MIGELVSKFNIPYQFTQCSCSATVGSQLHWMPICVCDLHIKKSHRHTCILQHTKEVLALQKSLAAIQANGMACHTVTNYFSYSQCESITFQVQCQRKKKKKSERQWYKCGWISFKLGMCQIFSEIISIFVHLHS